MIFHVYPFGLNRTKKMIKRLKYHVKKQVKNRKFWAVFWFTKVPFLLYLVFTMSFVPTIEAVETIDNRVILGAHRGASIDYEENTLEAFEGALNDSKYSFIEFDIQYTKDKKIVVFHQNTKYRVPKKFVNVSNLNYVELNEKFEVHIPEYAEAMDVINGEKPIEIEIKSHGNEEEDFELVDFIIADCRERGNSDKIMISSPAEHIVEYVEENYPEVRTGRVYWIVPSTFVKSEYLTKKFYEDSEADYLLMHGYNIHNYELLKKLKPTNKELAFWYFTDELYLVQDKIEGQEMCGFWNSNDGKC